MRPITVSVGPLAAASATAVSASQTPTQAGQLALNGANATNSAVFTGSIAGNVLTIASMTSGFVQIGTVVSGLGTAFRTVITGLLTGTGQAGTYVVSNGGSVSSTTLYGNAVATMDVPRRVIIVAAANESTKTFTITGTDYSGSVVSETLTGLSASTGVSVLSYATVTSVTISAAATGAITVGTNTIADSAWVRFDEYSLPQVAVQLSVTGTVNYTVMQSVQDTSGVSSNVTPANMTWINSNDPVVVSATGSAQTSYQYAPVWARVTLNSGSGSVTGTFTQFGVAPY